jgi:hypothetical protein
LFGTLHTTADLLSPSTTKVFIPVAASKSLGRRLSDMGRTIDGK